MRRYPGDTRAGRWAALLVAGAGAFALSGAAPQADRCAEAQRAGSPPQTALDTPMVVLAWNDLGMHCMNGDFSELFILPPFNNLHAQVILRKVEPDIMSSDVTVRYFVPGNTRSADKSNFWSYPQPAFGTPPAPNIGLTGNGLAGTMKLVPNQQWAATGIPIVPFDDDGRENPYPLAAIEVRQNNIVVARTRAVVPVSTEMSCNLCHNTPGLSTASDILAKHDKNQGTTLLAQKPVLCASCHADNALGLPGQPGVSNLSSAMHTKHAPYVNSLGLQVNCYACHPGIRTNCQRDVHYAGGVDCIDCHGDMLAVGNPARIPWVTEPRCGDCHVRAGFEFEQPGKLFKESVGHKGIACSACHGSPHAITPAVTDVDNVQAIFVQGHAGPIDTCTVCHIPGPPGAFFHKVDD